MRTKLHLYYQVSIVENPSLERGWPQAGGLRRRRNTDIPPQKTFQKYFSLRKYIAQ